MARLRFCWLFGLCLLALTAQAAVDVRSFDDAVVEQRYEDLTDSLRCPKCQNQAIGDSASPVAEDMRDQVYRLLQEGQSDQQILEYMTQRFGDYVLYQPRLEGRTWLLWGIPFALVLLGGLLVFLLVRARRHMAASGLSDTERARLDSLMSRSSPSGQAGCRRTSRHRQDGEER